MGVILRKTLVTNRVLDSVPFFFLAGPIRGAPPWHERCYDLLVDRFGENGFNVFIPVRYEEDHRLYHKQLTGALDHFRTQTHAERHYLRLAGLKAHKGCIIFYLPEESKTNPRPKDLGPYAQDTYGELGRWGNELAHSPNVRMVIGADQGFPGLKQIRTNLNEDYGATFPVYPNLEGAIEDAVDTFINA